MPNTKTTGATKAKRQHASSAPPSPEWVRPPRKAHKSNSSGRITISGEEDSSGNEGNGEIGEDMGEDSDEADEGEDKEDGAYAKLEADRLTKAAKKVLTEWLTGHYLFILPSNLAN